jgi:hypothetical protein
VCDALALATRSCTPRTRSVACMCHPQPLPARPPAMFAIRLTPHTLTGSWMSCRATCRAAHSASWPHSASQTWRHPHALVCVVARAASCCARRVIQRVRSGCLHVRRLVCALMVPRPPRVAMHNRLPACMHACFVDAVVVAVGVVRRPARLPCTCGLTPQGRQPRAALASSSRRSRGRR